MQSIQQKTPNLQLGKIDFSNLEAQSSGVPTPNQFLHSMAKMDLPMSDTSPEFSYAQEPSPPNNTINLWEDANTNIGNTLTMGFQPSESGSPIKRRGSEQVSRNRESFLEKNRVAAMKCRQKKKEYISSLETKAERYEKENFLLKGELERCRLEIELLRSKFREFQHRTQ